MMLTVRICSRQIVLQANVVELCRLVQHLGTRWLAKKMHLYTEQEGGIVKALLPEDDATLTPEDLAALKLMPGVYEAYEGLGALKLNVCVMKGAKCVMDDLKLAEFAMAPPSVKEVSQLQI